MGKNDFKNIFRKVIRMGKFKTGSQNSKPKNMKASNEKNKLNGINRLISTSFAIILIISCLVLGVISYNICTKLLIDTTIDSIKKQSVSISKLISSELEENISCLASLSKDYNDLALKEADKKFDEIIIYDVEGKIKEGNSDITDVSDKEFFVKALERKEKGIVSSPFVIPKTQKSAIAFSVPFTDEDGNVNGILVGYKYGNYLDKVIKNSNDDNNSYCFVSDKEGNVISATNKKVVGAKENIFGKDKKEKVIGLDTIGKRMVGKEIGTGEYTVGEKIYYIGYSAISQTNWSIGCVIAKDQILEKVNVLKHSIVITFFIVLIISFVVSILVSSFITRPLKSITVVSEDIADLNIQKDISEKYLNRKDETGAIAKSFQKIIYALRKFANSIKEYSFKIESFANRLVEISKIITNSSEEVSSLAISVADESQTQLQEVINVSNVMEEITYNIEQILEKVKDIDELSNETFDNSILGREDIEKVILGINSIVNSTEKFQNSLNIATDSSEKMDNITDTIKKISDQTNLLALNAAIEAARAGEYGRGFAVVADEIRKLAEESKHAALKIEDLINENQNAIMIANTEMDKNLDNVNKGIQSVDVTKKTFNGIEKLISKSRIQIEDIKKNISTVAEKSNQLIKSNEQVKGISYHVSSKIQSVSASAQEQSSSMNELLSASQELDVLSKDLQNLVKQFKTK